MESTTQKIKLQSLFNEALELHQTGKLSKADEIYQKILEEDENNHSVLHLKGVIAYQTGDNPSALKFMGRAISIEKNNPEYFINFGNALKVQGNRQAAIESYEMAIHLKNDYSEAWFNLGNLYHQENNFEQAKLHYNQALSFENRHVYAMCNLASIYYEEKNYAKASALLETSLVIDPNKIEILCALGNVYKEQQQFEKAIECYKKGLRINSKHYGLQFNLSVIYLITNNLEHSLTHAEKAIEINPTGDSIISYILFKYKNLCEWSMVEHIQQKMRTWLQEDLLYGRFVKDTPFTFNTYCDDPEKILLVAQANSRKIAKPQLFNFSNRPEKKDKIKIGYLSNDFYNHATAHLMLTLFKFHDRTQFEVIIFSYTEPSKSHDEYGEKIRQHSDKYIDIYDLTDNQAAQKIYEQQIDILVDLKGYTKNNRLGICALRPAPKIVSYLGFPGTTGADFIDYMIVDKIIVPKQHEMFYSEKLIYLPNCYQVTDDQQPIATETITRAKEGLPEKGFIFCCFNQYFKLEREWLKIWVRLLKKVPDSVLWLLAKEERGQKNIKSFFNHSGISTNRVIFAQEISKPQHLKRLQLADLALDTNFSNGHTTTTDAIWAGIPVLTRCGTHFNSRVAASILTTLGMPELIVNTNDTYEQIALDLALNPEKIISLKDKVKDAKLNSPLFKTQQFTKHIEQAYKQIDVAEN